jgi:hypothetical protein
MKNLAWSGLAIFGVVVFVPVPLEAAGRRGGITCYGEPTTQCYSGVCCRTHCTTCFIVHFDGTEEVTYGCGPWNCTEVR